MKKYLSTAMVLLLLFFLLFYPKESLSAARDGMSLWLHTLIPVLLPFFILTGFLVHTDKVQKLLSPLEFLWDRLFGLSCWGAYVFFLGTFCGCPMGPKLAKDLYDMGKLSKREASYLLTFTGCPSPAFLITYVGGICLKGRVKPSQILATVFLSNLLTMAFFRFVFFQGKTKEPPCQISRKKETPAQSSTGAVLDVSIMNGFETITRIGGYILLFSILGAAVDHFAPFSPLFKTIFLGIMELTTGIHGLSTAALPFFRKYLAAMTMASFGGLCIMAQTKSVLGKTLSIFPYASARCVSALFTAALILIFS